MPHKAYNDDLKLRVKAHFIQVLFSYKHCQLKFTITGVTDV